MNLVFEAYQNLSSNFFVDNNSTSRNLEVTQPPRPMQTITTNTSLTVEEKDALILEQQTTIAELKQSVEQLQLQLRARNATEDDRTPKEKAKSGVNQSRRPPKQRNPLTSASHTLGEDGAAQTVRAAPPSVIVDRGEVSASAIEKDMPTSGMYGIRPYRRTGSTLGWKVSIRRRGDFIGASFNARKYGGADQALAAALAFRDEVNATLTPMPKQVFCAVLRSTNTSGVPGVFRTRTEWKAGIRFANGRHKTRQFSVQLYGEEEAYRRAVEAREQLLQQVSGHMLHHEEMRSVDAAPTPVAPKVVVTPYKEAPANSPYRRAKLARDEKRGDVGRVNVKTLLGNGETVVTTYRVAQIDKPNGLPKRRYFSVSRYGEEGAERLAREQRKAWEKDLERQVASFRSPR